MAWTWIRDLAGRVEPSRKLLQARAVFPADAVALFVMPIPNHCSSPENLAEVVDRVTDLPPGGVEVAHPSFGEGDRATRRRSPPKSPTVATVIEKPAEMR